jgi:hypothetical protein
MRGSIVHDFARTSRDIVSSSGCAGATSTAFTSAVTADECRIGGTSDQPPFDDHTGEAGLTSTG